MLALLAVFLCRPRRLAVLLSVLLVFAGTASAQSTIHVPADQPTIQAAINAAVNGDTVLVSPGTYVENLQFNGKNITVTSSGGPAVTILDGNGVSWVVAFTAGEGPGAVLSGFTLRNAGSSWSAIVVSSASPTIQSNIVTGNPNCPGGISLVSSPAAVVANNTISNNAVLCNSAVPSGGIRIDGDGSPEIRGNTIKNNGNPVFSGLGGGISIVGTSGVPTPNITGNTIRGNKASSGGGIFVGRGPSAPAITQNLIVENAAPVGGGVTIEKSLTGGPFRTIVLTSNTIANNDSAAGSGVNWQDEFSRQTQLFNNLIIGRSGQTAFACQDLGLNPPLFAFNDIFSSGALALQGCVDPNGTSGNISADPLFASAGQSDYHLNPGSPAIDMGNDAAPNVLATDFEGNARVLDGDNDGSPVMDMGVYEAINNRPVLVPQSIDFGDQAVFTSNTRPVTLINRSPNPIDVLGAQISSGNTSSFSVTSNCPSTLQAGASCTFNVTFQPQLVGPLGATATVSFREGVQSKTLSMDLAGTGLAAAVQLTPTPSSLSFAGQRVGTTSAAQTVLLVESGAPLVVNNVSVTGPFSQVLTCSQAATPHCRIAVTFLPTTRGPVNGSLIIDSNAQGSPHTVPLSGLGTAPVATLSPNSLAFGNQLVGTTSSSQTVTLTNSGDATLQLSGIFTSGDFARTNNCGSTLAPAASCAINVSFTPTARGPRSGSLSISSDTFGPSPTVDLTGTGTVPIASLAPAALSFANQRVGTSSASQPVTLTNTGTAPLHITGFPVTGDFAQANSCPATLNPAAACTVNVTFTPSVTGPRTGTLTVSSDSADPVTAVSLSGTGVMPVANVAPASLVFSTQLVATTSAAQAVTLSNTGVGTMNISSIVATGDFAASSGCGAQLGSGASCVINVTFTPTAPGARTGTLSVASDGSAAPLQVALSGTGITGAPSLSPSSLAFGFVKVGTQSPAQIVNVTANGPGPLRISAINISAGFSQTNNCPALLSQGSSCSISVVFQPGTPGPVNGTVSIVDDGMGSPHSATLSGTGVDFAVAATPSVVSVDAGGVARTTVVVSALGGAFNSNVTLTVTGVPDGTKFTLSSVSVIPGSTSVASALTIPTKKNGKNATPPGMYVLTITGTSGSSQHSTQVTLFVSLPGPRAGKGPAKAPGGHR